MLSPRRKLVLSGVPVALKDALIVPVVVIGVSGVRLINVLSDVPTEVTVPTAVDEIVI